MLGAVDHGVSGAEARLAELDAAIALANDDAVRLSNETGPALLAALGQVREAGTHAAERARAAIASIIPESASQWARQRARRLRRRFARRSRAACRG
jgi:hypothetical protein